MRAIPALTIEKRLLRFAPKRSSCLSGRELSTLWNMNDTLVFLYLQGGNGFWVYIRTVTGGALSGYALIGNRWEPRRIALGRIAAFY